MTKFGLTEATKSATVLSLSRRFVDIALFGDKATTSEPPPCSTSQARSATKAIELCVGDRVELEQRGADLVVAKRLEPFNCLVRSYRGEQRRIAANIDHLYIVAAVDPLFNTTFIDRVICVSLLQEIPFSLILNKQDLDLSTTTPLLEIYTRLGIEILITSAKLNKGIEVIEKELAKPALDIVAFTGVSGVGKSSIINKLLPDFLLKTADVSHRTGQGRQTTTQPQGYLYTRPGLKELILVDLPGIQSFGVEHLEESQVGFGFTEIDSVKQGCEFSNCLHKKEHNCAVKSAVESGAIAASRYSSYLKILEEIGQARPKYERLKK